MDFGTLIIPILIVGLAIWVLTSFMVPYRQLRAAHRTNSLLQEQNLYLRLMTHKQCPGVELPDSVMTKSKGHVLAKWHAKE